MISLQQVSKTFKDRGGSFNAVQSVSLEVGTGEIHGIIGASGAGKSTLLRMINVLERPDQGKVFVGDKELTALATRQLRKARHSIGMIFQQYNLVLNRTVSRNISMAMELAGVPKPERLARIDECLRFVGLEDKANQYPSQLSGGQMQRVAIARALANSPQVLLCDEPTSALDPQTTADILEVLRHVNQTYGVTILIVTHDMNVVKRICSRVSVMEQGKIVRTAAVADGEGLDDA
ncbi:ATP-binding cassette domain-containing protein [Paenibacillus sp. P96]|uniref:ATP-binding cassette domain-containing protein n=1 Tax=Paenibacillus zeirhizosphaerae TaxID=2987519 RepID=A0ABT9FMD6_9BACL|nr:ATP-binding cassette domain-containing protein [Paenibacillus sp. P96]MDP4095894.1 ATP-binding cassette domain-containing protein [Paenibacillus sp. P96]